MRLVIAWVLLQMASPTTASCFIYILISSPIYYFTLWWKIKELFNLLQHEPVLDIQLAVWTFLEASSIFILSSYIMSSHMAWKIFKSLYPLIIQWEIYIYWLEEVFFNCLFFINELLILLLFFYFRMVLNGFVYYFLLYQPTSSLHLIFY